MTNHDYDFRTIEPRWQARWEEDHLFRWDPDAPGEPYYCLMMYPYPSGTLHMGHVINYTIGDVLVRSRKMMGRNVLSPMGWDAFGLPAENAAIQHGTPPAEFTRANIDRMRRQMIAAGWAYDWSREISTAHPGYYRWTQWIFGQLYRQGLATREKAPVNWCDSCQTVLANEQVVDGACERCGREVDPRDMTQWFFRMSRYAQRLLDDHAKIRGGWPDRVIRLQEDWIGRSEGARIDFTIESTGETLSCFTTRPDTLFGVTWMSIAPEHPLVERLVAGTERETEVMEAVARMRRQSRIDRTAQDTEKIGVDTGLRVVNPATGESIPLWVASYALMGYGTGAVMAVPAHDQRDFLFARQHGLPIRVVIAPDGETLDPEAMTEAYEGSGVQVDSGSFDGLPNEEAKGKIVEWLTGQGKGEGTIEYALRDWLISRQRYWGVPIPLVHCPTCGEVLVPDEDLPVVLPPEIDDFSPRGKSPLEAVESFVRTTCPECGGEARRETDTMDTFVDSSWYFLRYLTPRDEGRAFDRDRAATWMPVHQYVGGIEHASMHLVYCRFLFKVLHDLGEIDFDEPAARLFCQGMVCQTAHRCPQCNWIPAEKVQDGGICADCGAPVESSMAKMSKSKLNVTSPDRILEKSGADCLHLAILSAGPPDQDIVYRDDVVTGARRFLHRLWETVHHGLDALPAPGTDPATGTAPGDRGLRRKTHQTIARVTDCLTRTFGFNTAISAVMELIGQIRSSREVSGAVRREALEAAVVCLAPLAPHITEELWSRLGRSGSIFVHPWPEADTEIAAADEIEVVFQINGKLRGRCTVPVGLPKEELERIARADGRVAEALGSIEPTRVIVIPDKLVNIVIPRS